MKHAVTILGAIALSVSTLAHADIFMCKDSSGRTYTSDRPIPECANSAVREYANNGMLKKRIAAPLTAEQKREKLAQEEKKKAEQAAAEEQKKADRALLARYRSEDDITRARKRESTVVNEQIAQQKIALTNAEKEQQAAQAALSAQQKKGSIPANLKSGVEKAAQDVRNAEAGLQESEAELVRINTKYDLALQRFREVTRTASSQ
jgi:hypothetical protein